MAKSLWNERVLSAADEMLGWIIAEGVTFTGIVQQTAFEMKLREFFEEAAVSGYRHGTPEHVMIQCPGCGTSKKARCSQCGKRFSSIEVS